MSSHRAPRSGRSPHVLGGLAAATALICAIATAGVATAAFADGDDSGAADPGSAPAAAESSSSSPAAPAPPLDQQVKIRNVANGGAILPTGGGTDQGIDVDMINRWDAGGQVWTISDTGDPTEDGDPTYSIHNEKADQCLTIKSPIPVPPHTNHTKIMPCTTDVNPSQEWIIKPAKGNGTKGSWWIIPQDQTNRALAPDDPTVADGHTWVQLKIRQNSKTFGWRLEKQ
ncbi:RICIN domain-containing protein [Actinomadura fibrosa]|uniref:RICIN domain-containing protein n=1 Tax=Actinomadura fibrosa TaxID=111802 RepID=A0ABW2XL70_9ACTN|nr:RICIN domain-containing protein [Actinomadura fibrosa]